MNNSDIYSALNEIFQDIFGDDDIELSAATTADDIDEWDSITHIQLMVAIEKHFSIRLSTGEVAGLKNVGEMVELLENRLA